MTVNLNVLKFIGNVFLSYILSKPASTLLYLNHTILSKLANLLQATASHKRSNTANENI